MQDHLYKYNPIPYIILGVSLFVLILGSILIWDWIRTPKKITHIDSYNSYILIHGREVKFTTYFVKYISGGVECYASGYNQHWSWCDNCLGKNHGRPQFTFCEYPEYNILEDVQRWQKVIRTKKYTPTKGNAITRILVWFFVWASLYILVGLCFIRYHLFMYTLSSGLTNVYDYGSEYYVCYKSVIYTRGILLGYPKKALEEYLDSNRDISTLDFIRWYKRHK